MTNNKIQKGIESLKKIQMSSNEASMLRENLLNYVDKTLEVETVDNVKTYNKMPILSQYFKFNSFKPQFAFATFSILGLFIIGAGAVGAAKTSLPGDILYPLKVKVVEPIQGLLMLTPVSKVNFEAKKIDNRLNEVEALVKNNNLNKDNREVIEKNLEKNFEDHAKAFDNFVKDTKDTEVKNTIIGTTTEQTEFENNIDKHSVIFDKIKENIPEAQKEEVKKLEDVVNTKMNEFKEDRKDDEEKSSHKESEGDGGKSGNKDEGSNNK